MPGGLEDDEEEEEEEVVGRGTALAAAEEEDAFSWATGGAADGTADEASCALPAGAGAPSAAVKMATEAFASVMFVVVDGAAAVVSESDILSWFVVRVGCTGAVRSSTLEIQYNTEIATPAAACDAAACVMSARAAREREDIRNGEGDTRRRHPKVFGAGARVLLVARVWWVSTGGVGCNSRC